MICGEGVAIPMRVRIDLLDERLRPQSADPMFSARWAEPSHDSEWFDRVILRWRRQSDLVDTASTTTVASLLLRKA